MEPELTPHADPDATAITPESEADNISLSDFTAKITNTPPTEAGAAVAEPEPQGEPSRHRSRKQQARAGDVPRIAELTRRLRETEAERDALKGGASATPAPAGAKVAESGSSAAVPPVARAAAPLPPVKTADKDPEPDPTKYDDLTKYFRDLGLWTGREALRSAHAEHEQESTAASQRAESARLETQWKTETSAAKVKYADFEQVAYAPTRIPKGSLPDAWILEHKTGPLVLYHLQKHPQELDAMLASPLFEQVEALTLLSQRLSGSRSPAVVTGAAAAPVAQPVSRPPTPVRTGAMRASEEPPDPESVSLSGHTKYYGTPRSRRERD
jgi:hypothetical protein